jgi:hypothetical protein
MERSQRGSAAGLLWLAAVIVIGVLLAQLVNAAVGGIVGVILAILVFLLVIREA